MQTVRLHGADILAIVVGFPSEQRLAFVLPSELAPTELIPTDLTEGPETYYTKRGAEPVALVVSAGRCTKQPPHIDFVIRDEFKDQRWVQDALRGLGRQLQQHLQAEGVFTDLAFMDGR